ncbi:MAG: hypothetical protein D6737_16595 [Chloroflexi bacterium]|nr:MAG: hypothetical protein D6737_16595 [Chloroflexota bacterium]
MALPKAYYRPKTLDEAVELCQQEGAVPVAGGAMLLGGLTLPYEAVVDLQDLQHLGEINYADDGLHIGGVAMLQEVVESVYVWDEVKQTLTRSIPLNIRNNTSVGESLIAPDAPLEWLTMLSALGAEVTFREPGSGVSTIQMVSEFVEFVAISDDLFRGVIMSVHIPPLAQGTRVGTAYVARTPADAPIVNVAAVATLNNENIIERLIVGLGGKWISRTDRNDVVPVVVFHLEENVIGQPLDEERIESIADAMVTVEPVADYRGSVEYRREMARVLTRRALQACIE